MSRKVVLPALLLSTLIAAALVYADAPPNLLGRTLYLTYCAECHGMEGRGDGKINQHFQVPPTNFRADGYMNKTPDSKIFNILKQGLNYQLKLAKEMPHFTGEMGDRSVEELIQYMRRIPEMPWNKAAAGKEPYMNHCAPCHGEEGQGDGPAASRLKVKPADLNHLTNSRMKANFKAFKKDFVTGVHGKRMADFFPSAEALVKLYNYLDTFAPGRAEYNYNCAMCHGEKGDGVSLVFKGKALKPKSIVEPNYLANTPDEELRHIILQGQDYVKDLSGVNHFDRPLSDREINAVIKYMRDSFF